MAPVKFGIFGPTDNLENAKAYAIAAERDGFYSYSTNDHIYSPFGSAEMPQLECFTTLTAIAGVTSKLKLVPSVASALFRPPALLAKIITTLDIASNGRFICGIGAGWMDKEYLNHGYPFPPIKTRLEQLDETIQVIKTMCHREKRHGEKSQKKSLDFKGRHYEVRDAYNNPPPVQPHIPIMLGGSGTGLLKIAAREADIINLIPPTSKGKDLVNDPSAAPKFDLATLKQRIELLHSLMRDAGRKPQEIELSGLLMVGLSPSGDGKGLRDMAKLCGFGDLEVAKRSPLMLMGTAEEARQELRERIDETGVTYYICTMATPESKDIFVNEVMPEFADYSN